MPEYPLLLTTTWNVSIAGQLGVDTAGNGSQDLKLAQAWLAVLK